MQIWFRGTRNLLNQNYALLFLKREENRYKSAKNCSRKRSTIMTIGFTRERNNPLQVWSWDIL